MKAKSYLLAFTLMLAGALLVGCTKTTQATTTKKVDPTSQSTTKSTQGTTQPTQAPTQPTQKVKVDLAKPVITVNQEGTGVTVAAVEHATKMQYKVDDDQYADVPANGLIEFSKVVGEHTVLFRAVGDDDYNDSISDAFEYETKDAGVKVTRTSVTTATLEVSGLGLKVDEQDYTENTFTVTESGKHKFEVADGWDGTNKIFYNPMKEAKTVVFAIDSEMTTKDLISASSFESNADLIDAFAGILKYEGEGWKTSTATATLDEVTVGGRTTKVISLNCWNNKVSFAYVLDISDIKDGYKGIAISVLGNDWSNVSLQLQNSETGVYANYNLGIIDSNALTQVILFSDENWEVHWGSAKVAGFGKALNLVDMFSTNEAFAYFDKCFICVKGDHNNESTRVYLNNISLLNTANLSGSKEYYVSLNDNRFLGTDIQGINYDIKLIDDTTGTIDTLNLTKVITQAPSELNYGFTYTSTVDQATAEHFINVTSDDKENGVPVFTLKLKVLQLGKVLKVVDATGEAADLKDKTLNVFNPADITMAFGSDIISSWKRESDTGSGFVSSTSTTMYYKNDSAEQKYINMYASTGITNMNTYTFAESDQGMVDYVSMKLGNWFKGGGKIQLKIMVVDANGAKTYLVGDASNFATFNSTSSKYNWREIVIPLKTPVSVKSIVFVVKATGTDRYLCIDDIKLGFNGYQVEKKGIEDVLTIDFEDGTIGSAYGSGTDNKNWTREKLNLTTQEYEAGNGAGMNCRKNDKWTDNNINQKFVNFVCGGGVYRYVYSKSEALGVADHMTIQIANYFNGVNAIGYKIALVDADDPTHIVYLAGSAGSSETDQTAYEIIANNTNATGFTNLSFDFTEMNVGAIVIIASTTSSSGYLYCDNIQLINK